MNLIEEIINKMPKDLETDLEKALFIYIETCKMFNFDTRYDNVPFMANLSIILKHPNINKLDTDRVVCSVWSDIYADLLKEVGIEAEIHNVACHEGVIIYLSNGKKYYADATFKEYMDLARVKHNDKIDYFYEIGVIPKAGIPVPSSNPGSRSEIDALCKKVGYEEKTTELIEKLKKELESIDGTTNKMNHIINSIDLTGFNTIDDTHYLRNIINKCISCDYNVVQSTYLKRMEEDGNVKLLFLLSLKDNDHYTYYMFDKLNNIRNYNKKEVYEYAEDGYGISKHNLISKINKGFNYPLIYTRPISNTKYFLKKIIFQNQAKQVKHK